MSDFTFNGISASSLGLTVEYVPGLYIPKKRLTTHSVPGRCGDLTQWDGSWENYPVRYPCWFKGTPTGAQLRKIAQWLSDAPAGARLEDTYDDSVYRLATYVGGADVENIRNTHGRFVIEFSCDPRKFLKSGDTALNITSSGLLNNPTTRDAYPIIEVTGTVGGLVTIGETHLLVRFPGYDPLTLRVDTYLRESWDITDGGETSMNEWISGSDFPVIVPGVNQISISGGITSIRVYPRWWTV